MDRGATHNKGGDAQRSRPRSRPKPDHLQVKTYVILRRVFSANRDAPNVEVLDVKLNLASAEAVQDQYAGTWIERVLADKRQVVTARD